MGKVFAIIANKRLLKISSNVLTLILAFYFKIFCDILDNFGHFVAFDSVLQLLSYTLLCLSGSVLRYSSRVKNILKQSKCHVPLLSNAGQLKKI